MKFSDNKLIVPLADGGLADLIGLRSAYLSVAFATTDPANDFALEQSTQSTGPWEPFYPNAGTLGRRRYRVDVDNRQRFLRFSVKGGTLAAATLIGIYPRVTKTQQAVAIDDASSCNPGDLEAIAGMLQFPNVAALEAYNAWDLDHGTAVYLQGYSAPNGIGASIVQIDKSRTLPTGAADGGVNFKAAGGTDWFWRRPIAWGIFADWFGLVADANSASGPANDQALNRIAAFLQNGYLPGNIQAAGSLKMLFPPGVMYHNQPLKFDFTEPTLYISMEGHNKLGSIFRAGAGMADQVQISEQGQAGQFSGNLISEFHFDGNNLADNGVNAEDSRAWQLQRNFFVNHLQSNMKCTQFNCESTENTFDGRNNSGDTKTHADGVVVTGVSANAVQVMRNVFNQSRAAVRTEGGINPQGVYVMHNVMDNIYGTCLYLTAGCRVADFSWNVVEHVGKDGVQVEVADQSFETWYGALVVATPRWNALSQSVANLRVHKNRLADIKHEALASIRMLHSLDWTENTLRDENVAPVVLRLMREGALYTQAYKIRVRQESSNRFLGGLQINSADTTANTITLNRSINVFPGMPLRLRNISGLVTNPAVVDEQIVFCLGDTNPGGIPSPVSTIQIAQTIADAVAGTALDITTAGTSSLDRVSQFGELVDFSQVDNQWIHTSALEIAELAGQSEIRSPHGLASLGGNPSTWTQAGGTADVTLHSEKYEGVLPIYQIDGPGRRELTINLEESRHSIKGKYFGVHFAARGNGGVGGILFQVYTQIRGQPEALTVQETISNADWQPNIRWTFKVPRDAVTMRIVVKSAQAAVPGLFTRFAIAECSQPPDEVMLLNEGP